MVWVNRLSSTLSIQSCCVPSHFLFQANWNVSMRSLKGKSRERQSMCISCLPSGFHFMVKCDFNGQSCLVVVSGSPTQASITPCSLKKKKRICPLWVAEKTIAFLCRCCCRFSTFTTHWQGTSFKPQKISRGSKIICTAHFNSKQFKALHAKHRRYQDAA